MLVPLPEDSYNEFLRNNGKLAGHTFLGLVLILGKLYMLFKSSLLA
jgi:hypothetical protein